MKQLLITQIKGHINALKKVKKEGVPFDRLKGKALDKYLESLTVSKLEHINSELRMRRFRYDV
ncbi:hypothetical protein ES704_01948 [subsurface metagenome]